MMNQLNDDNLFTVFFYGSVFVHSERKLGCIIGDFIIRVIKIRDDLDMRMKQNKLARADVNCLIA